MLINVLMGLGTVVFFVLMVRVSAYAVRRDLARANEEVSQAKTRYQSDYVKKCDLERERKELEDKAVETFVLYDITREITKTFNEQEAVTAFQMKLKENIFYEECRLLDPLSEDVRILRDDPGYLLFVLRGKTQLLGYLAIKGVRESDQEKAAILTHQFALALQRIRLYQEVERLAMTDSLTGLLTRRCIMDRFDEELKRARARKIPLSFLMIDVDHFKRFNDQHGHLAGDQILCGIAGIIRENIREIDIAGRFGGEEFCVVLPDTQQDGASYVAERIRAAVQKSRIKAYDTMISATVSIGLAAFPRDGEMSGVILDKADWALYRAKKNGRNCVSVFGVY